MKNYGFIVSDRELDIDRAYYCEDLSKQFKKFIYLVEGERSYPATRYIPLTEVVVKGLEKAMADG